MFTKLTKTISQKLFNQLGFSDAKITVDTQADDTHQVNVAVDPEQSGILIGFHGETISALQLIISLILNKKSSSWQRLILNINDYRQKRHQSLSEMAHNAAERVRATKETLTLPPLSSFDRRIIHLTLSNEKDLKTESVGEGKDRRLTISFKKPATRTKTSTK